MIRVPHKTVNPAAQIDGSRIENCDNKSPPHSVDLAKHTCAPIEYDRRATVNKSLLNWS
ncbi:hypothetical protein TELCIR_11354 [Teladorsagia circumcincta]|uniref:Uncharacterized protein n=1 Tax=Teladorsagia circumcincta TaxID=45464 RepID=A0A2G9U9H1_TELCI|nr:hypothetical protein TELCIR_11354 [Teladorsagia circumcincta]